MTGLSSFTAAVRWGAQSEDQLVRARKQEGMSRLAIVYLLQIPRLNV